MVEMGKLFFTCLKPPGHAFHIPPLRISYLEDALRFILVGTSVLLWLKIGFIAYLQGGTLPR